MDRRAELLRILSENIDPIALHEICSEGWLANYPGGFGPAPLIDAGNVLEICPERILACGEAVLDIQFMAFCEAIRAWQHHSAMDYALQLPPDLIVAKFAQDFPAAALVLSLAASHAGLSLFMFIGAGRGAPETFDA